MITSGRWDLVEEAAAEADAETGLTRDDIVFGGVDGLTITGGNCGQYNGVQAMRYRNRPDPTIAVEPGATPTAEPGGTPAGGTVQGLPVADFYQASCSPCHGANRAGLPGLGLPLTPEALTQPDDFYFDTIKNGRAGTVMPAWGQNGLTDDDIRTLIEFLKNTPP